MAKRAARKASKKASKASRKVSKRVMRITTGVPGLDRLVGGGFVAGSTNLLAGGTGTGKTVFCMQYLMDGLKKGEKCLFITLEETPEDIVGDAAAFGWDLKKFEERKRLSIEYMDPIDLTRMTRDLLCDLKKCDFNRIVIDSTSLMGMYFKDPFEVRKQLSRVLRALKDSGATTVLTAESTDDGAITRFGVEEFISDSVMVLRSFGITGELGKSLTVRKMRRTSHDEDVHPIKIGKDGLKVLPASRGVRL